MVWDVELELLLVVGIVQPLVFFSPGRPVEIAIGKYRNWSGSYQNLDGHFPQMLFYLLRTRILRGRFSGFRVLDLELELLLVVGIVGRRTRPLARFLAPDFGLDDPLKLDSPHLGFRVSGFGSRNWSWSEDRRPTDATTRAFSCIW